MTTKEGEGGTGLGLAIVRERVQGLLAGTVVCLPRAGGGTLFAVEFPTILAQ
jgi:signal transduction histidine kinase